MNKPKQLLGVLALSLLLVPQVASADLTQEYVKNRALRAQHVFRSDTWRIIRAAEAAEAAGRMDDALELFRQAYTVEQTSEVELEYGLALFRAKKYLKAARHLMAPQRMGGFSIQRLQYPHSMIQEAVTEATKEVGVIVIDCNVPQAQVHIGQELIVDWPFVKNIPVEPDTEVEVTATAPGYYRSWQKVKVAKGHMIAVRIGLMPVIEKQTIVGLPANVNLSVNDGRAPAAAQEPNPTWPLKLGIASGIGIGLGAVALGFGLDMTANAETDGDARVGRALTGTGIALGGVSLAGLIVGLVAIANRPAPTPPPPVITISPSVGAGEKGPEGGVTVQGKF